MEDKLIEIKDSIDSGKQRQLIELTRELAKALNEEEFIKIVNIYNGVINRLIDFSKMEGIEI